jgi:hypothetical protein
MKIVGKNGIVVFGAHCTIIKNFKNIATLSRTKGLLTGLRFTRRWRDLSRHVHTLQKLKKF